MTLLRNKSLKVILAAAAAAGLLLAGCDSDNKTASTPKETPATTEYETGRFALQKMLGPAHFWAPDAQPIRLESTNIKDSTGHDGKANFWRALFGSVSRQKSEPFSWSGITTSDAHKGVDHGTEDSYNPNNRSYRTFDLNFLKSDTDKAFEVAQQHGGKQLLEKEPKTQVSYVLDWDSQSGQLRWHVIYGGSESMSKLTVLVDASSGNFIRRE
ncbi:MAG TPA: hypothetical protein VKQ89_03535 [Candidatus Angelobacter sp.]|nr:hypothetical protein [Candidatus Angelobacter sp.]